ncbi:MAG: hypothetical protein FWG00_03405 [Coriobacteriia bacterium]|nr:hypothetical protein [Coriobacteriia bacterium]
MRSFARSHKQLYHYDSNQANLFTILSRTSYFLVAVAVLLSLFVLCSPLAYAEQDNDRTPQNEQLRSPLFESPHEQNEQEVVRTVEEVRAKTITRIVAPELLEGGYEAIRQAFEARVFYADDTFEGYLDFESLTFEPAYRTVERQIERVAWYSNLPAADIIHIPTSRAYLISSDEGPGASITADLEMAAIRWISKSTDAAGRPVGYTAEVTYRGSERELIVDYITATALYRGTFTLIDTELVPQAQVVSAPFALPMSPLLFETIPGTSVPYGAMATTVGVLLLGVLAFAFFIRRWNVKLIALDENGSAKTLARKHVRLVEGRATFVVPEGCSLVSPTVAHVVRVKQSLVDKGEFLNVVWRGCLLFQLPLACEIDLQKRLFEMAAASPLDEIIEVEPEGSFA